MLIEYNVVPFSFFFSLTSLGVNDSTAGRVHASLLKVCTNELVIAKRHSGKWTGDNGFKTRSIRSTRAVANLLA